jgi:ABC-type uncharacterized transport system fused permease/ATPase subunit
MVPGSLKDQITYPEVLKADKSAEDSLKQILDSLELSHILERVGSFETVLNWEDILSLGEQQRIAMARLFFHKPLVAILDECTSALNVELEEKFYTQLKTLGISFLSVGHRPGSSSSSSPFLNCCQRSCRVSRLSNEIGAKWKLGIVLC